MAQTTGLFFANRGWLVYFYPSFFHAQYSYVLFACSNITSVYT